MRAGDLDRIFPSLAKELAKQGELAPGDIAIEKSPGGMPVLLVRGMYVHSSRDPVREGRRLAEAALRAPQTEPCAEKIKSVKAGEDLAPVIILGFGLGYAAEAAAAIEPERPIIIIEKYPELLRAALEARDLEKFLTQSRVVFVLGKELSGVGAALSLFEKTRGKDLPPYIKNRALISIDPDWYAAVENKIKTNLSRNDINTATLKRFGRRWVRNLSSNFAAIRDIPGIGRLEGILKGKNGRSAVPVFLAAAGPGLDVCADFIKKIAARCVVVAADTSLRFLLRLGVEADFVVSVDPQYWNFRHLDRLFPARTQLVAESAVYPPCLRNRFAGTFLGASFFPPGRFIESRVDPKGELGAGGSVATSAWDFARILGADTIWIAGLDLSFPALKTHFKGALFEDRSLSESNRFSPAETWNVKALRGAQPFFAANAKGGKVMTDRRLSLYASWFENRFRQFPAVKNFSFSDEGLAIAGLEYSPPEILLAMNERRREIDSILNEAFSGIEKDFYSPAAAAARFKNYDKALVSLVNGLDSIKKVSGKAAAAAKNALTRSKIAVLSREERGAVLKELDRANEAVSNSEVKDAAGFLLPEISESATETGDSFLNHLEFSSRFYTALEETSAYNIALFKKQTALL